MARYRGPPGPRERPPEQTNRVYINRQGYLAGWAFFWEIFDGFGGLGLGMAGFVDEYCI